MEVIDPDSVAPQACRAHPLSFSSHCPKLKATPSFAGNWAGHLGSLIHAPTDNPSGRTGRIALAQPIAVSRDLRLSAFVIDFNIPSPNPAM